MESMQLVLVCWICQKRVHADSCKIDEFGEPVHEDCDRLRRTLKDAYLAEWK